MPRFLRFAELKTEKGIPFSRMHIDRLEKAGKFPKRVSVSAARYAYVAVEIDDWIAARISARQQVATR